MTKDKSIFIKNIYYMLSYAFRALRQTNYESVAAEQFDDVGDLFAAILSRGIAQQLKHGLYREYTSNRDTLTVMRGKLDLTETIKQQTHRDQKLACEFDELSENNLLNRILKTTAFYLLKYPGVDVKRKNELRKVILFFDGIELLDPGNIPWNRLSYRRNNKSYEMLINICYLFLDGMLQTTESGEYRLAMFDDEHMERLYERFILEYYRKNHAYLSDVKAGEVKWDLAGDTPDAMIRFLPSMQTDIMLRQGERTLIIDAKYYGKTLQRNYDKRTLYSNNLYQIFTYVKNHDKGSTGNVSGLLLYAKTDEEITPDCVFDLGGNLIGARTLDLNVDFSLIASQLDKIVEEFLVKEAA